jgi:hypothetical protein
MFVIARYYETAQQARDAYAALRESGFRGAAIALVTPPEPPKVEEAPAEDAPAEQAPVAKAPAAPKTAELTASAMKAGNLLGEHSDFYASNLAEGQSLVVVQPPFGGLRQATAILEKFGPLDIVHEPAYQDEPFVPISRRPAPLSNALGWRVLSDKPAPLSEFWGLNTVKQGRSFLSRMFGEIGNPNYALFGEPTPVLNPAPLSSMFGLALLSGKGGDNWTKSLGFSLLSQNPAPLSKFFGMPLLSSGRSLYR